MNNYKITAKPSLTYVTPNRIMSFLLEKEKASVPDYEKNNFRWFCFNNIDKTIQLDYSRQIANYRGPRGQEWKDAKWTKVGHHRVVCKSQAENKYYEYDQHVVSINDIIKYSHTSKSESLDPVIVLANLQKEIQLTREIEKEQSLTKEDDEAYQKRMKDKEEYAERLAYLINEIPESHKKNGIRSFRAEHFSHAYENVNSIPLRMGYFYLEGGDVYLLDWTNPVTQGICGVFKGKGQSIETAMEDAISKWDSQNRYPKGIMNYAYFITHIEVNDSQDSSVKAEDNEQDGDAKHVDLNEVIATAVQKKGSFNTDGESNAGFISKTLSYIGLAAAVIAGVVTLVAPVPGSRVVSVAIWTAIATTTTSAVINIADRHMDGFTNYKEDAFDALTIVGNLFSAGVMTQAKWLRYSVAIQGEAQLANAGTSAIKYGLIGQITTDSLQGIMVVADVADAIYTVKNDSSMPADIKLQRIAALLSRAAIDGTLVYVSIKGSSVDLGNIKGSQNYTPLSQSKIDELIGGQPHQSTSEISSTKPLQNDLDGFDITQLQLESNIVRGDIELPLTEGQFRHVQGDYNVNEAGNKLTSQIERDVSAIHQTELETVRKADMTRGEELEVSSNTKEDNTNTREVHTKVNDFYTRPRSVLEEMKDEARAMRERMSNNKIKDGAALARTSCPVLGIESRSYVNIKHSEFDIPYFTAPETPKEGRHYFIKNEGAIAGGSGSGFYYSITDVDLYINLLKEEYKRSGNAMHIDMENLIREFIQKNNGQLSNYAGLPGAHAEVQSTNDVFNQLRDMGKTPRDYFNETEVVTIRFTKSSADGKLVQDEAFPACLHCSGILHQGTDIKIITGRVDGQ